MAVSVEHGSMRVESTSAASPEALQASLTAQDEAAGIKPEPVETPEESVEEPFEPPVEEPPAAEPPAPEEPPQPRDAKGQFQSKHKKGSLQYRIDQATYEREQAKREAAKERQERERLAAQLEEARRHVRPEAPKPAAEPPAPAPTTDKPKVDDFNSYEEYVEALSDWKLDQKLKARDEQALKHATAQQEFEKVRAWQSRQEEFAKTVDDYKTVVENDQIELSGVMREVLLTSPQGPQIAYYLGTHPEEATQIARDSLQADLRSAPVMRRYLESLVSSARPASSGPVPAASRPSVPAPIKPVGGAPVVTETSPDSLPFGKEYVERMNARELQRLKAKAGLK